MLKLYYTPVSCSRTQHILLELSGLDYEIVKVDLNTKLTEDGNDFTKVNPRGQVPTLQLDDHVILTENVAIGQYIADKAPNANLLAPIGDITRYQTISWMSFVATELHKAFSPLFHPKSEDDKLKAIETLITKLNYVEKNLNGRDYIASNSFTIADAYLFVVLNWRKIVSNLPTYPNIDRYVNKINAMPAIQKVIAREEQ
ncbi:glutathione transferase GstA [Orbaceae bacterium ac157xtp]